MWTRFLLVVLILAACKEAVDVQTIVGRTTCRALYEPYIVNRNLLLAVGLRIGDAKRLRERAERWEEKKVTAQQDLLGWFSGAARDADVAGGSAQSLCEMTVIVHKSMDDIASIIADRAFRSFEVVPSVGCPNAREVSFRPGRAMSKWEEIRAQLQRIESGYIEQCRAKFGVYQVVLPPAVFVTAGFEPSADDLLTRFRVK